MMPWPSASQLTDYLHHALGLYLLPIGADGSSVVAALAKVAALQLFEKLAAHIADVSGQDD
jgi:hypothetical protein